MGAEATMVEGGCCVCDVSCLCAFSWIPISPFFHFMKCFFSLVSFLLWNVVVLVVVDVLMV